MSFVRLMTLAALGFVGRSMLPFLGQPHTTTTFARRARHSGVRAGKRAARKRRNQRRARRV